MRDAVGGVFNVTFVAIFLAVVSGYLAFSVSYNKAFKVKNKIISTIEQYQGYNTTAQTVINDYIVDIGYNSNLQLTKGESDFPGSDLCGGKCTNGYCVFWIEDTDATAAGRKSGYFKVITSVNVSLPVLNKFLPNLQIFQTSGDTMTINTSYGCNI